MHETRKEGETDFLRNLKLEAERSPLFANWIFCAATPSFRKGATETLMEVGRCVAKNG